MTTKYGMISVSGLVLYCDGCGRRGPEVPCDNRDGLAQCAEVDGWVQDGDRDLCDECATKKKKAPKKAIEA
jgi:hypothetical protein